MEIIRKIALFILLPLGLGLLPVESWGSTLTSGIAAPNFLVESGDDQRLSMDKIRGRVIVLFYESRQVIKKNKELKDELTRLYHAQPANIQKDIFRLVVIDCAEAFKPLIPIWKMKLNEHSRIEGFTIYGDWTRNMLTAYHMKAAESNFLIIDRHGVIRYSDTGKIAPSQFEKIEKLLFALIREG